MEPLRDLATKSSDRLSLSGFRKFILRGNVVDLAVGIVIGAAFQGVVKSLVADFITPIVTIPLSHKNAKAFETRAFHIGGASFGYGDFINNVISFLLIALAVYYFVVLPVNGLMERFKPETEPGTQTKKCPECISSIPWEATRCAFCTVEQPPLQEAEITAPA